jgi:Tol biopolymer transport system component
MKVRWPAASLLLVLLFATAGSAARTGGREPQNPPADGSADIGRGNALPVLFYSGRNDNKDVYILHPGEKEPRNLTDHPAQDLCPAASPDGKSVLFLSDRDGNMDIFSMAPDGKRILFVRDGNFEVYQVDLDGGNPVRLTDHPAWDGWACYLPVPKR